MKAGSFRYERAYTLAEVFRLRRDADGDVQLLAGGQSLLASLAFRLSEPSLIIDISRVPELKGISVLPSGHLRVGALTTHRELAAHPDVGRHAPLLAEAVPLIAHAAIRNRGTIGGSLAFADAAAELPACCVALAARIVAVGPERRADHSGRKLLHRTVCHGPCGGRADPGRRVSLRRAGGSRHHRRADAAVRRLCHGWPGRVGPARRRRACRRRASSISASAPGPVVAGRGCARTRPGAVDAAEDRERRRPCSIATSTRRPTSTAVPR